MSCWFEQLISICSEIFNDDVLLHLFRTWIGTHLRAKLQHSTTHYRALLADNRTFFLASHVEHIHFLFIFLHENFIISCFFFLRFTWHWKCLSLLMWNFYYLLWIVVFIFCHNSMYWMKLGQALNSLQLCR